MGVYYLWIFDFNEVEIQFDMKKVLKDVQLQLKGKKDKKDNHKNYEVQLQGKPLIRSPLFDL